MGKTNEEMKEKVRQVDELRKTMTAVEACKAVGIHRSNYFSHKSRMKTEAESKLPSPVGRPKGSTKLMSKPIIMQVNESQARFAVAFVDFETLKKLME